MKIKLLGKPRYILGKKEVELDIGKTTLREVIGSLPQEVQKLVVDGNKIKMIVLINGVSADSRGGLDAEIRPEDEITIMPEIGGG